MAAENAEFGSQKLPTTVSVGALRAARSVNLPCGGFFLTAGLAFLVEALSPPRRPKRIIPLWRLGLFFASFRSLAAIFPRCRRALERGATRRLSLSALCGRRVG